jgi:sortase A
MTRRQYLLIFFSRLLGYLVILSVLTVLGYQFWPAVSAELAYRLRGPQEMTPMSDSSEAAAKAPARPLSSPTPTSAPAPSPSPSLATPSPLPTPQPLPLEPVDRDFGIVVPKIGANAAVIANVSTVDTQEYQAALKKGVAHAKGTALPGEKGNSYLFAHSTRYVWDVPRYNAIFYLLHELQKGDRVVIFYHGRQYDYRVTKRVIAKAEDTSWLTAQYDEPVLTLQTCFPPGTTWKRMIVVAKLVAASPPSP